MIAPRVGFLAAFLASACFAHVAAGSLVLIDRAITPAMELTHVAVLEIVEVGAAVAVPALVEVVAEVAEDQIIDNINRNHCHPVGRVSWVHRAATGYFYWNDEVVKLHSEPIRDPWQLRVEAAGGLSADERCDLVRYGAEAVEAGLAEQAAAFAFATSRPGASR